MNDFQAMLEQDARDVFFNPAEFGRTLAIDGRQVAAMWSDSVKAGTGDAFHGVNVERRVLLVLASDMARPMSNQELEVEGVFWTVGPVADRCGLYEIELLRNLS